MLWPYKELISESHKQRILSIEGNTMTIKDESIRGQRILDARKQCTVGRYYQVEFSDGNAYHIEYKGDDQFEVISIEHVENKYALNKVGGEMQGDCIIGSGKLFKFTTHPDKLVVPATPFTGELPKPAFQIGDIVVYDHTGHKGGDAELDGWRGVVTQVFAGISKSARVKWDNGEEYVHDLAVLKHTVATPTEPEPVTEPEQLAPEPVPFVEVHPVDTAKKRIDKLERDIHSVLQVLNQKRVELSKEKSELQRSLLGYLPDPVSSALTAGAGGGGRGSVYDPFQVEINRLREQLARELAEKDFLRMGYSGNPFRGGAF